MKLTDIVTEPWSIIPDALAEMRKIYKTHFQGPKIDLGPNEANLKEILLANNTDFKQDGNIAVIDIRGTITKQASIIDSILFDTISSHNLKMQFLNAIDDPDVDAILLMIDSPGGSVDGTQEFANLIYENRDKKPIIAYSDGVIASAAYWIGAAAHSVYISGGTARVGSIGVIATHMDWSKMDLEMGIKTTEIIAGKFKNVGTPNKPLSEEHEAIIQDRIDYIYSLFVADVAKFRGVSIEAALTMADGKIFTGKQAIDAGLVDGEFTEMAMVDYIKENVLDLTFSSREPENKINDGENNNMEKSQILEKFPLVHAEIVAEGEAKAKIANESNISTGKSEGVKDENARINSIYDLCTDSKGMVIAGHGEILKKAIGDEKATAGSVAIEITNQNKAIMESKQADLEKDAEKPSDHAELTDPAPKADGKEDFKSKVADYQKDNDCTEGKAVKEIARAFPDLHEAYLKDINEGGNK